MRIVNGAAAGNIGRRVAEQVIEAGAETILLVRDPAKLPRLLVAQAHVAVVDMADATAVVAASNGADALFWLIPPFMNAPDWQHWYHIVGTAGANALRENQIPRAVLISSLGAGIGTDLSTVSYIGHTERLFNETGKRVVHLRPGYFMQNFLMQADIIRTQGFVAFPYAEDHDIPFVSATDIAATAARYLLDEDWAGQWSHNLMGQTNLTLPRCAAIISEAWGHPVTYRRQSYEQLQQDLARFGLSLNAQQELVTLFRALGDPNGVYATPRTPDAVTPTSFQTFVRTELLPRLQQVDKRYQLTTDGRLVRNPVISVVVKPLTCKSQQTFLSSNQTSNMNATANQQLEQILINALDAMTRNDISLWVEMFTDAGVMEFPYAPPGYPDRIEGKDNLTAYLAGFPEIIKYEHINPPTFHHSENVMVAEFSIDGKGVKTGSAFHQRYISVIEHRAGKVVHYVDYWNPLVVQEVMGDVIH